MRKPKGTRAKLVNEYRRVHMPAAVGGIEQIAFHPARAVRVYERLHAWYREGRGFFQQQEFLTLPEIQAVSGITSAKEQATLLFLAVGMDRNVDSRRHYPLFRRAYDADKRNTDLEYIAGLGVKRARMHFNKWFSVNLEQIAQQLHASCTVLAARYGGDPIAYLAEIDCVHDAVDRIGVDAETKLPGFGKQLAKLLVKNYVHLKLVKFSNEAQAAPKVDRHNQRIGIATRILTFKPDGWYHSWAITKVLDKGWHGLVAKERIDGVFLNNALWQIGSKHCVKEDRTYCIGCPLYGDLCVALPRTFNMSSGQYETGVDCRKEVHAGLGQLVMIDGVPPIAPKPPTYEPHKDKRYLPKDSNQKRLGFRKKLELL